MLNRNTARIAEDFYKKSMDNEVILVKLEALLNSFLEDDFLGYMFNKYGFLKGMKYLFFSVANYKKFQLRIQRELEKGNLLESLNFNHMIIQRIQTLIAKGHPVCLISTKYQAIVHSLSCYLNFHYFFGNKIGEKKNFYKIFHEYSLEYKKKTGNNLKFTLVSDEVLFTIAQKATTLVQTGPLYKILINFICKKEVYFVPSSNTFNRSIFRFMALLKKRRLSNFLVIVLIPFVPFIEMAILVRALYFRVLISIVIIAFFNIVMAPEFLSMKIAVLAIFESNNIVNFYKIINASYPVLQHEKSFRNEYLKYGLMKSYTSFRIGLFIYFFISLIYFSNIFVTLIQILYLGFFLTFPMRNIPNLYGYSWVFTIIQSSLYYLIIIN